MLNVMTKGAVAGAAATVALDVATYGDMALRGRPSSTAPADLMKVLAQARGLDALAADDDAASNRRSGLGALSGYAVGIAVGVAFALIRPVLRDRVPAPVAGVAAGLAAMALADVPLVRTGLTDPATWGAAGWAADVLPHLIYGVALAATFDAID